jgi:hypothetical protein
MTKDEIMALCEADDKLLFQAMILFADLAEFVANNRTAQGRIARIAEIRVDEFARLVIGRQVEKAKGKPTLEQRVARLEGLAGIPQE